MEAKKPLFSVLMFNLNEYEKFHDLSPDVMNEEAEYIYVTNNPNITSNTWKIVLYDYDVKSNVFDACYWIRYNPFKFVNSDIVIKIDGSFIINKDLTPLVEHFIHNNYELGVVPHQSRTSFYDEYITWCNERNYSFEHAKKCMGFISSTGYDIFNYKGLYLAGFMIQKNDKVNNDINQLVYNICKKLADNENEIERIDQIIFSYVLNKHYNSEKILPITSDIMLGNVLTWCAHGSDNPLYFVRQIPHYLFNNEIIPFYF